MKNESCAGRDQAKVAGLRPAQRLIEIDRGEAGKQDQRDYFLNGL